MSPKLIPISKGSYEPVQIVLDSGETLIEGDAPAEFSRQDAKRIACYPDNLRRWLKDKGAANKPRGRKELKGKGRHGNG